MNWDAIGAIAELLGAVGVIASLVYLTTQIRQSRDQMAQNTRALRAGAYQQFGHSVGGREMSRLAVPGRSRTITVGLSDFEQLNEEERDRFSVWA
jgi:hypothetical protein